jgi:predicted metal-dependent phosphoesterase TrpH
MKCDLHVHTSYSYDSKASPKEMVEAAIRKGINCLAITDHGEIKGASKALEYTKGKPILIIPGIEIKSKEGDILGLNIKKVIPNGLSAQETIRKIKEAGGLAIIPHPFGWFCSFRGNFKKIVNEIEGIEVLNASIFGPGNKKALAFAQKFNLPFTAGSDAHSPNLIGRVYLEILGENLSIKEIFKQIKNREVRVGGEEASFFEKIIDHLKRNFAKIKRFKAEPQTVC